MAEALELELKVAAQDAIDQLRKARNELDGCGGSADKAGKSVTTFGANLGGYVVAAKEALRVISSLAEGIRDFAREADRQQGILAGFSGSVEEARRRTGGLVSQLDLIEASNRAAAAGFRLSERQLANVAVAVAQYGRATGDAAITTESLATAIAQGEEGPLKKLGICLEGVTGVTRRQDEALRQLEQRYGDQAVAADGLADSLQQADGYGDDLTTGFFEGFTASESLKASFSEMTTAVTDLGTAFGVDLSDGMDMAVRAGAGLAAIISRLADGIAATARAVEALSNGDFLGAYRAVQDANAAFVEGAVGNILAQIPGLSSLNDTLESRRDAALGRVAEQRAERAAGASGRTITTPGRGRGRRRDAQSDFSAQWEAMVLDLGMGTRIQRGGGEEGDIGQNAADLRAEQIEREQKAIEDVNEALEEQRRIRGLIHDKQEEIAAREEEIRETNRQAVADGIGLAEQGAEVLLEAFNASEGPKAAVSAALEVARAVSDFASYNYVGGAGHLISA